MNNASELPGYPAFLDDLRSFLSQDQVIEDYPRRLAYGTDASFYRLVPRLVVKVSCEDEVVRILDSAHQWQIPITFRAGGTSLSGQAITDAVLVKLDQHWTGHEVLDAGQRIRLQPGLTGAQANRHLAPFARKIGPDPASIDSAMIGGIAANNASGMCCGTDQNSYRTLAGMRLVLHDGYVLDTGDAQSRERFFREKTGLCRGLAELGARVRADAVLSARIREKFRIKNTTGYSLNALLDYEDPIDILQHLLIGSEGTLGFISEITYHTVHDHPHKATALVFYPDVHKACRMVEAVRDAAVSAAELIDRASLRSIEDRSDVGVDLRTLPAGTAALLVETRAAEASLLEQQMEDLRGLLSAGDPLFPVSFSTDARRNAALWGIRKGLFPALGHIREKGTTVIIEDVAFPLARLADAIVELQQLFKAHGYDEAIIFGHALAGNVHFVFTQNFDDPAEVDRYAGFMQAVADLVVDRYDGSLKAEHGTGRNMAPFVEKEWGRQATQLMRELKSLLDPLNILNPGVLLTDDARLHLKNLKPMPAAHEVIDKCIECGFCEVACPSKNLSITPRQRIVLWREINRLMRDGGERSTLRKLQKAFDYLGDRTCATDGLCATRCPVDIDTGKLIKSLRQTSHSPLAEWVAVRFAHHMGALSRLFAFGLTMTRFGRRLLGDYAMQRVSTILRSVSLGRFPAWTPALPAAAGFEPVRWMSEPALPKVVYLPSCAARTFGAPTACDAASPTSENLPDVVARVLRRAGFAVVYPEGLKDLCCGKSFEGKGFVEAEREAQSRLATALERASDGGRHPILCDTSPCLKLMRETLPSYLQLYEPIVFAERFLIDKLPIQPKAEPILLHLTCSARKMGLNENFLKVVRRCAVQVVVPPDVGCCGFAGDKGFFTPELNESALETLTPALVGNCSQGYSTNLTCEIGLSSHTGVPYRSLFYLLDEVSQTPRVTEAVPMELKRG
ncbi:FAD-binding and (Fe-S)-binding domain-containing protein [Mangrovitalea sediminis]|uniref:FAD-binding and (Fe-S)-binding domain-containing protein n=1 Tax=Mangrovitalea sediminis TaxID=1982043 RepID=UPI000BE61E2A|nr:FAD-binding and (Fe-S)-binding domain-containing protein [Mangrovitalea sediminis]